MNNIDLKAMDVAAIRVFVSSIIMFIGLLCYDRSLLKIKIKDSWCFVGTGIFSLTMFNYCYFSNILLTSPGFAAVLLYTSPIFIMLMSAAFFGEKLNCFKIIACIMTLIGCVFVSDIIGLSVQGKGLLLGILSGIGYSLYSIFGKVATKKGYNPITITVYTFIFGCIGTAPFTNFDKIFTAIEADFMTLVEMVLGAIITTIIPYLLYTIGLKYIETTKAGVIAVIEVVVAAIVGRLVFNEAFSLGKIFGILLIITAIILLNIETKSKVGEISNENVI